MTSIHKMIIPACLMVVLLSMAFANIAYADEPIWRESNNLYGGTPVSKNSEPKRIYFYDLAELPFQPGTYTLSFKYTDQNNPVTSFQYYLDGHLTGQYGSEPFTFTVPEGVHTGSLYIVTEESANLNSLSEVMINSGSSPLPYEPYYSGFRFDFSAIAQSIAQYVQPVITIILPYIFLMIALIIGINAGIRVFRKTAT